MKRVVRLPDVGEGVAEAELVAWHVAVGDAVTSDTVVAEVMTDKATVEIYAPVAGTVASLHGGIGEVLAVGSDFFVVDTTVDTTVDMVDTTDDTVNTVDTARSVGDPASVASAVTPPVATPPATPPPVTTDPPRPTAAIPNVRAVAAPAVRERARTLGVDLAGVRGTGADGRVTHDDLDRTIRAAVPTAPTTPAQGGGRPTPTAAREATAEVPLIGLRRRIAERMTIASSRIPHITYVDEIDMTQLEHLRGSLATAFPDRDRVTVLPFVIRAVVLAVAEQPRLNATFDDDAGILTTHAAVHIGIATQTTGGLMVPVVRNAQTMDMWETAAELVRVTTAARNGTALRDDLSGSTITITSLGALGGLVTTPIINHPEVAIIGINKMQIRPVWDGDTFVPRTMMNLSSSFDHRIVDGWDAATFIQRIRTLLEEPALLFTPQPPPAGVTD